MNKLFQASSFGAYAVGFLGATTQFEDEIIKYGCLAMAAWCMIAAIFKNEAGAE